MPVSRLDVQRADGAVKQGPAAKPLSAVAVKVDTVRSSSPDRQLIEGPREYTPYPGGFQRFRT